MTLIGTRTVSEGARRYRQELLLGRGGMADVYVAYDESLERRVALKVLRDTSSTERLQTEARTLARLSHPGLVTVLDVGEVDGRPFIVMELVEGVTLAECCAGASLEPGRVAALGAELAATLDYVHRNGVIHRDVKPANILLARDGRVLLADFGVARLTEGSAATETGITLGTAAYLSPEQVRSNPLTPAVDIYSLGLVLLEALTGERAYPGPAVEAAVARLHSGPAIPDELPEPWRALLGRMTAAEPDERPTALDVAQALGELAQGTDPVAAADALRGLAPAAVPDPGTQVLPLPGRPPRFRGRLPRSRALRLGALLVLAVLVVLVVVSSALSGQSPPPSTTPVPSGVPSPLVEDLAQLHDAVVGR